MRRPEWTAATRDVCMCARARQTVTTEVLDQPSVLVRGVTSCVLSPS